MHRGLEIKRVCIFSVTGGAIHQREIELSPEVAIAQFYSVVLRIRMPPCLNSGKESTLSVNPGQADCEKYLQLSW